VALVAAGLAAAALLLAFLFHLGVAAVAVAILATVPTGYVAWKALPGPVKKPALGRLTSQWTPWELGVHPVVGGGSGGPMPAYVPRHHDELLRAVLDPAVPASRLVVLRGGSSTGKTRAACEAVIDRLPNWRLDYPQDAGMLAARLEAGIPARTVLWLDKLPQYADGDGGPAALARLADLLDSEGHLVITTMWPEHWQTYLAAAQAAPDAADPRGVVGRLLGRLPALTEHDPIDPARGGVIDVPDRFTTSEMTDLADTGDPVLAEAAAAAARGGQERQVTQYLAGVPELLYRYNGSGGDPYGQAIITAAMDAARLGHASPLPAALLQDAAVGYLTGPQRTISIESWRDTALAWATYELRGAVRAVQPLPPPTGTGVAGYQIADYLGQHGRRTRQEQLGPASLWDALTAHATSAADLTRLGQAARDRGLYRHAAALWTAAAARGDTGAAAQLIILLRHVVPADTMLAARWAVGRASLDEPWGTAALVLALLEAGADDAAHTLAARVTSEASPDDATAFAKWLDVFGELRQAPLRGAAAGDAAHAPLANDHLSLDDQDPWALAILLDTLHEAGTGEAVLALLAHDPTRLDNPGDVAVLLRALHETGAGDAAKALAARAANHSRLGPSSAVASLLRALHETGAVDVAQVLAARAANAGMFNLFLETRPDEASSYLFGREPGGTPSQSWNWQDLVSQNRGL
jgi:hypothetical protein